MSVQALPATASLIDEWDHLADRSSHASPWLRPGWVLAWRRAFGRGRLEIVTLRRDGRLAALLPLERRLGALRSTANYHTPSFGLLAEDRDAGRALLDETLARRPHRLELAFLEPESVDFYGLRAIGETARYRLLERVLERSPYVPTEGGWDAYRSRLDGKMLRELRRRRRHLENQAPLEVVVEDGNTRRNDLLDEGFRVEASAWKGRNQTAIASQPETDRFYRDVATWAAERGWLRLAFLRLGGRPIAFDFAIEEGRRHHLLKTGYDPEYRALGPAMLLRYEMISRAFEVGLATYEFGGRDEPWKLQWSRTTRDHLLLQGFRRSVHGFVEWAAFTYGRPLAKRVLAPVRR
jgi:CelD/BcsL family acetyltransferase involved in cellulose biosynthesis